MKLPTSSYLESCSALLYLDIQCITQIMPNNYILAIPIISYNSEDVNLIYGS